MSAPPCTVDELAFETLSFQDILNQLTTQAKATFTRMHPNCRCVALDTATGEQLDEWAALAGITR